MSTVSEQDADDRRRSIGSRRSPETESAILDAADAIMEEVGIAGFSIEAVAKRARAGKPTIYKWWPSKTALLLDIYQRRKPADVHADTGTIEGDVRAFIGAVLRHWSGTGAGEVFRFIVAEAQRDEDAAAVLESYASERLNVTVGMFDRAIARGEVAADTDTKAAAETLIGYVWYRLLTGHSQAGAAELDAVARQMVGGILV